MTATVNGDTGFSVTSTGGYTFGDGSVQSAAANGFGYKNRLINGNMAVVQRGASFAFLNNTNLQYGIDRWYTDNVATGIALNVTQNADTSATYGGPYYANLAINSIATSGYFNFAQRIESKNTYDLASATCTLSFTASLTGTGGALQLQVLIGTPSVADNYTTTTLSSPVVISATSTPTRFTVTFTASSTAYNGQAIIFKVINTGSSATNVTLNIGSIQLEKGSSATNFDVRPYNTELALCQRYYYRLSSTTTTSGFSMGQCGTTTTSTSVLSFPVSMRTAPTIDQTGTAADYQVGHSNTNTVCSAVPSSLTSEVWGMSIVFTVAAGLTAGRGSIHRAATTSSYLGFIAEL